MHIAKASAANQFVSSESIWFFEAQLLQPVRHQRPLNILFGSVQIILKESFLVEGKEITVDVERCHSEPNRNGCKR